ncbi:ATP-binding protein [Streptomyces sp. bgisy159]|uniref:ATP-binding protein n=1 Tax=Streptomyces sp. bgisy159 TaxID=3413795 RepID=UPI003F49CAC5
MSQDLQPRVTRTMDLFTAQLCASRRSVRVSRLLAERELAAWGVKSEAAAHVVAELVANAVLHGRVRGRDFRLRLMRFADGTLRVEVTDPRGDRVPRIPDPVAAYAESGRGLRIVAAYAERWGVEKAPAGAKIVWAELVPGRGDA